MIKLNDKVYRIGFLYGIKEKGEHGFLFGGKALSDTRGKHIWTICEIQQQNEDLTWRGIAGSYIIRNPNDPFSKPHGRRATLHLACCQIQDKQLRALIWNEYFGLHKDAGWGNLSLNKLAYQLV